MLNTLERVCAVPLVLMSDARRGGGVMTGEPREGEAVFDRSEGLNKPRGVCLWRTGAVTALAMRLTDGAPRPNGAYGLTVLWAAQVLTTVGEALLVLWR